MKATAWAKPKVENEIQTQNGNQIGCEILRL